ncbi:MAG TPA: hemerythrin domain-containing protein [Accumulibacter sp.]|nr:hemerythrin domain-containing protein [Accumulibacter sp.]HMW17765.1 hemerythrin domain-containing protein [Accumulibacter sp.]HMX22527.1 hemerythrin domain-containing protein [Accumulibacter sp.]HMY05646.1 hemerythrin domain-containing protein [Accumulibacter sp.]HNC17903.1 hemerythrin domain-containing protein [Accumulibacter sp.]
MDSIAIMMTADHRSCDTYLAAVEQAVHRKDWSAARAAFAAFQAAMLTHFSAEEAVLFPQFEQHTGISRGPTQVMRNEHLQMRQLLTAAGSALASNDQEDYRGEMETLLIMMQQHNVKEENVLYPMCDQHLVVGIEQLLADLQSTLDQPPKVAT